MTISLLLEFYLTWQLTLVIAHNNSLINILNNHMFNEFKNMLDQYNLAAKDTPYCSKLSGKISSIHPNSDAKYVSVVFYK